MKCTHTYSKQAHRRIIIFPISPILPFSSQLITTILLFVPFEKLLQSFLSIFYECTCMFSSVKYQHFKLYIVYGCCMFCPRAVCVFVHAGFTCTCLSSQPGIKLCYCSNQPAVAFLGINLNL